MREEEGGREGGREGRGRTEGGGRERETDIKHSRCQNSDVTTHHRERDSQLHSVLIVFPHICGGNYH